MEMLDLGFNSFHGTIRESLFYSKSLKYLDLGNNYLSGDPHDFFKPLVLGTLVCFSASTGVSMVYLVHTQPRLQSQQRNQALFFLTCPTLVSLVVSWYPFEDHRAEKPTCIVSFSQSSYWGNVAMSRSHKLITLP